MCRELQQTSSVTIPSTLLKNGRAWVLTGLRTPLINYTMVTPWTRAVGHLGVLAASICAIIAVLKSKHLSAAPIGTKPPLIAG